MSSREFLRMCVLILHLWLSSSKIEEWSKQNWLRMLDSSSFIFRERNTEATSTKPIDLSSSSLSFSATGEPSTGSDEKSIPLS